MHKNLKLKLVATTLAATSISLLSTTLLAHTRLEVPQVTEGIRVTNNVVVGHGCGEKNVIGTSVVFPDGVDSTITVDGAAYTGKVTDFIENWGNLNQKIYSTAVFKFQDEKYDANENVLGFWEGGVDTLPHNLAGFIPFRVSAATFAEDSCASSVKFYVSIADICQITPVSGFSADTVNLWTHNNLGTPYDRAADPANPTADDGPASLTFNRAKPLPASCGGTGKVVEVKPSATQINRDMPIKYNGTQVWPVSQ